MSSKRFITLLAPVIGLSKILMVGTPFMFWLRACRSSNTNTSGTIYTDVVVLLSWSTSHLMRASLRMGRVIYTRSIWPVLACSTRFSSDPETGSRILLLARRTGSRCLSSKNPSRSRPIQGALAILLARRCPSGPAPAITTDRVLNPLRRNACSMIRSNVR